MVHEHPGVYSSYDASSVIGGKKTARILGAAAVSTTGTANEVVTLTSYAEGVSAFGEDAEGTVGMAALLAALYRNGAAVVKAVKVSAATPTGYEAAFAALEQEAVDVIVCDSTSVDVQLKLRASVEKASGAQRERIGVVSGGASETAAKLVERAGKLNSERMVLTAPGDVRMAAAAAAVIAGESDPSVPVNGAVLAGFSGLSASYDDTQVDTLVTGGVTPLECVSGEVSIVRGITTRTTTGGAADKTWRELTTVRIVDDVIPALRASLRARFVRSKNTAQVRAAIRSQVMVELENKRAQEIIDSFGEVSVKASEDDPTVCLVEFSFAVVQGYSAKALRTSREVEAFGESEPVATVGGQTRYTLELSRLYATDEAIGDGVSFYELDDFSVVVCRPGKRIIYSHCRWSNIEELGKLGEPVAEKVTVISCKRMETDA